MSLAAPLRTAPASKPSSAPSRPMPRMGWLEVVVVAQTLIPALMFVPGLTPVRTLTRVLSFALPLMAWAAVLASGRRPAGRYRFAAASWMTFVAVWYVLSVFHPNSNTLKSAAAQSLLCIAILCPVFWAPALVTDTRQIRRLMLLLLACNGASALMGIAQIYRPDTFRPPYIPALDNNLEGFEASLSIRTDDGRMVLRPTGLTDTPGGAGIGGILACLTGLGLALSEAPWWKRGLGLAAATAGLAATLFSQARNLFLILGFGMMAWVVLLVLRRDGRKLVLLGVFGAVLAVGGVGLVVRSAGTGALTRVLSLFEGRLDAQIRFNRGVFVESALTDKLPRFPLGAGLGRAGMTASYFGDPLAPPSRGFLWAETQVEMWVYDGGIVMLVAYPAALIAAMLTAFAAARRSRDRDLGYWASVTAVFGLFNLTFCLGYAQFMSPMGVQFWTVMAALHGADALARVEAGRRPASRPAHPAAT